MEIILSILFIIGLILYCNAKEANAYRQVDWKKANNDKLMNDLSKSQMHKNIMSGKYNGGKIMTQSEIKASQDAAWEDFKRRHPHGSWN